MTARSILHALAAALAAASGPLLLAGVAQAHPHAYVDQQVQLSPGLDSMRVRAVIIPSAPDGAAILAHIDADGDGAVSANEAAALGADVMAAARLAVDGRPVPLEGVAATVAAAEAVAAGTGAIVVEAVAAFPPLGPGGHEVAFEIGYDAFAHAWFVQPFYDPALVNVSGTPVPARSTDGARVVLRLPAPR